MTKIKPFFDEEEEDVEVETTNCNISAQHKQNKAKANIILLERQSRNNDKSSGSGSSSGLSPFSDGTQDLRPKFAILKHKSELLNSYTTTSSLASSSNAQPTRAQQQNKATTPNWFFNIPTFRSPFPDFGSKLPPEDDE